MIPQRSRKKSSSLHAAGYRGGGTDQKKAIREAIMDRAEVATRILTFPAREGNCVEVFRKRWPDAEIVGIERDRGIVRESTLEDRFGITFYRATLDDILEGKPPEVRKNIQGHSTTDIGVLTSLGIRHSAAPGVLDERFDYGMFDLAYLDFCGKTSRHGAEARRFIKQKLMVGGTCALTFTLSGTDHTAAKVRKQFSRFLAEITVHDYLSQAGAKMICLIGKKT